MYAYITSDIKGGVILHENPKKYRATSYDTVALQFYNEENQTSLVLTDSTYIVDILAINQEN